MLHKMHLKNFSCKPGFIYFIYAANYSPLTSRYHCHAIRKNIYDGTLQHVECLEHIFISSCFIWKDNKTLDLRIPFWSVCLTRYFNMYTRLNKYGYIEKDGNVVIIIIGILEIYDIFQSYHYAPNLTPPWQIYGIYSIYYITRICCQILTLKSCIKHFFGCNFIIRALSLPYLLSTKSVCHLNLFSNSRLYFINFCVNDI